MRNAVDIRPPVNVLVSVCRGEMERVSGSRKKEKRSKERERKRRLNGVSMILAPGWYLLSVFTLLAFLCRVPPRISPLVFRFVQISLGARSRRRNGD